VLTFIVRRLLALPLVMLAVTLLIVTLMQFLSPEQRAASFIRNEQQLRNLPLIVRENGLDQPFYVQYANWLRKAAEGNLGYSRASARPVLDTIRERFPATVELALFAALPIIAVGIWLGTAAGLNKDRLIDQISRVLAVIGYSLPSFVLGIWLLVIFYGGLGILPGFGNVSNEGSIKIITSGMQRYTGMLTVDALLNGQFAIFWDAVQHLILPTITLSTISSATILKVMRSSLIEVMRQDYVRTARSKGLGAKAINIKHGRRNALLPVATLAGFTIVGLLNGVIITETIFAYPGIGSWGAQAATILDYPGVLGFAVFTAFIVVVANIAVDVAYGLIDPRVRFD
jgi:ABC-type dipeptide/oligopeptide/nickel transport system permease component